MRCPNRFVVANHPSARETVNLSVAVLAFIVQAFDQTKYPNPKKKNDRPIKNEYPENFEILIGTFEIGSRDRVFKIISIATGRAITPPKTITRRIRRL